MFMAVGGESEGKKREPFDSISRPGVLVLDLEQFRAAHPSMVVGLAGSMRSLPQY
jgi:hypothetical protein